MKKVLKFPTRTEYDKRALPDYVFTTDYTVNNSVLYIKGDVYSTYNYNYDRLIRYLKKGLLIINPL